MSSVALDHRELGDQLSYRDGELWIEEVSAADLIERFGTPLHVISRAQLADNYTRLVDALRAHWPSGSVVHYSIKANHALAVRRVFTLLGAGGDCMGLNELRFAFEAGTDPRRVNLNGNFKDQEAIDLAVENGVRINIDHPDEIERVAVAAKRVGRPARLAIRGKPTLEEFGDTESDLRPIKIAEYAETNKWGVDLAQAEEIVQAVRSNAFTELEGLHYHLGRQLGRPELFELMIPGVVRFAEALRDRTGWQPASVNLGGGLTQGRDPFSAQARVEGAIPVEDRPAPSIDLYAQRISEALRDELRRADLELPVLELESGRYLVANAGISLGSVGSVKTIGDRTWVNVDLGTHQIGMLRAPRDGHAVLAVHGSNEPKVANCQVVGPLCTIDALTPWMEMPRLAPGDHVAFLDTGAYADAEATNSNLIPRPAVVMVDGKGGHAIRVRETYEDLKSRDRVPLELVPPE